MQKLSYKKYGEEGAYYLNEDNIFFFNHYVDNKYLVGEYNIIDKIRKNEDGYFDFSKNIIDVGAFNGCYSLLLDFNHNYCFEPNKNSSAILWTNAYIREKAKNTDVFNVALSDKEETTLYNGFECEIFQNHDNFGYKGGEKIQCKTLDSFNLKNVGFIKIDVEGFEEKVRGRYSCLPSFS